MNLPCIILKNNTLVEAANAWFEGKNVKVRQFGGILDLTKPVYFDKLDIREGFRYLTFSYLVVLPHEPNWGGNFVELDKLSKEDEQIVTKTLLEASY